MSRVNRQERISRELAHSHSFLTDAEKNWGWGTPAGRIRKSRRASFLTRECAIEGPVLEIGCGTGTYSRECARSFKSVISLDLSEELLQEARKRFPEGTFLQGDIHALTFDDESLAMVIGCSILHHLDIETAAKEIFRVLKPSGVIRFSEPNLLNPQIFLQKNIPLLKRWAGDSPDEYAFTRIGITNVLKKAGFTSVVVTPFEFLHPSIPERAIPYVVKIEELLHKTILREIGGSLLIEARKPSSGAPPE